MSDRSGDHAQHRVDIVIVHAGTWLASRLGRFTHEERTPVSLDSRPSVPQRRTGKRSIYTNRSIEVEGTFNDYKMAYS